jgi:hypothetical protein
MADDRYIGRTDSLVALQDDFVEEFEKRMKELTLLLATYASVTRRILVTFEKGNSSRNGSQK